MASEPISQLTQTTSPSATDCVPIVFNGVTQKASLNALATNSGISMYGEPYFYSSGQWILTKGSYGTVSALQNYLYVYPLIVSQPSTFTQISVQITSASASGTVFLGVYNSAAGNMPGTLIATTTTSSSASAAVTITQVFTTPLTVAPGIYWVATLAQGAAVGFSATINPAYYDLPCQTIATTVVMGYYMTGVSGTLPTTFAIAGYGSYVPRVWIKFQ